MNAYALQWIGQDETSLCETERNVVYVIGSKLRMMLSANQHNNEAKAAGWSSRYRAVPLPFTGPLPDYATI